ncbi:TlyA family RNA methyltransferase [Marinimicrobium sp. ABcell2]|uniref:TlyA family RNA methyltransferase n=1 Tax=Marinimicrobium sp. ABcell2 TaxID=3069751 RepID=UPI0027B0E76F|nr:TlyA family RNA methyltransferase [Marinimicrobium sp. ABcell2]MDQ2077000.1 TlyA family RNA methyltransferase [Marinimicrobium sp. ABcell2]
MKRLDVLLVESGLAASRSQAQRLIDAGAVLWQEGLEWRQATKASQKLPAGQPLKIAPGAKEPYVSRGGIKLAGALSHTGIDPNGWTVLDVGQSTGGFTDCLVQTGARQVVGVDVGHGQLVDSLRAHPNVVCFEGINARELPEDLLQHTTGGFDLVVMDVSFISQTLILPGLCRMLKPGGFLVSLVKPQFEVGKEGIGKGGIVRDESLYRDVEQTLRRCCETVGLSVRDYFPSPITGGDGNREFFICAQK